MKVSDVINNNSGAGMTPSGFDPLKYVADRFDGAEFADNTVTFPEYGLKITLRAGEPSQINSSYTIQLIYILEHEYFEEKMTESVAGFGDTLYAAMKMGAESFCTGVLHFILIALKCEGEDTVTAKVMNDEQVFRVPCTMGMFHVGEQFMTGGDFWHLLRDEITGYLGKKKAYWIKLYAAWAGDHLTCEARINNIMYPELTEALRKVVKKPAQPIPYGADKQFILLIQKDDTYQPAPYTQDQVKDLVYDTIERMKEIDSSESYTAVTNAVFNDCPVKSLAREMITFIPEIYCCVVLNTGERDSIIAHDDDTDTNWEMKRSQLRGYGWIDGAVYRYIREKAPSKEDNMKILGISSRFKAAYQAITQGAKLEDLVFGEMMYRIDKDYIAY
ncbi:MAG: hypothetical protein J5501_07935 [Ruminococcus sp.]|nr:hypothetical protein [Ruminococcus sp.]